MLTRRSRKEGVSPKDKSPKSKQLGVDSPKDKSPKKSVTPRRRRSKSVEKNVRTRSRSANKNPIVVLQRVSSDDKSGQKSKKDIKSKH